MQVEEIANEGLRRELRVVVPAAELEEKLGAKLEEVARTASMPGFRPGKVPPSLIRKMHGERLMAEVVENAIRESMEAALKEREMQPAYQPDVRLEGGDERAADIIAGKADLAYVMTLEVLPDMELPEDFSGLSFTRHRVKVADEAVEEALAGIARQFQEFEEKPEGEAAAEGDRVVISFVGRIDGEEFEGGKAEDVPLQLGSGQFIPGFEDQLIGAKAGEERVVKVRFPDDYGAAHLAGKEAEFAVKVNKVEAPVEMEMDDAFAARVGFESMEALRARVREQLAQEMNAAADEKLKEDVLDTLAGLFDFPLPERLVAHEFEHIWEALTRQMRQAGRTFEDEGTTEEEAREEYRRIAERRVRLGLVIGRIGERAGVQVSDQEMQQALLEKARQYPGQERQVIEFYQKTPEALIELRGPIFEAKVIDHILGQAKVEEREITREELEKLLADDEESDAAEQEGKAAGGKSGKESGKDS